MAHNQAKKCLLVIPRAFYSFELFFGNTLRELGYEVVVANDECPANVVGKIMGKLRIPLLPIITRMVFPGRFLKNRKYDLILIFKGRGMSPALIQKMFSAASKVIAYNWDSFIINRAPLRWYKYTTRFCTFDFDDGEKYGIPILELFSSLPAEVNENTRNYFIVAIIKNHSERLQYLDKVLKQCGDKQNYIYIYESHLLSFVKSFFRNPKLYLKYRRHIYYKALPYAKYLEFMKSAEFVLDYATPDQSGITIRCYEALSTHTRIISNNKNIQKSKYFNSTNSILFQIDDEPSVLLGALSDCLAQSPTYSSRTIKDFLNELIAEVET